MTLIITSLIFFALSYAVKGGQLEYVFKNVEASRKEDKVLNVLLSGKVLSTLIILVYGCLMTVALQQNIGQFHNASLSILSICLAWVLAVAPSMGEEYGGILGQGPYIKHEDVFGLDYAIKKGIQRGVWSGAMFTLATGSTAFLWASFAFMPIAAASLLIGRKFKFDGWAVSELIIGATCFGLPMGIYLL